METEASSSNARDDMEDDSSAVDRGEADAAADIKTCVIKRTLNCNPVKRFNTHHPTSCCSSSRSTESTDARHSTLEIANRETTRVFPLGTVRGRAVER